MKIKKIGKKLQIYSFFFVVILLIQLSFVSVHLPAAAAGKSGLWVESIAGNVRVESSASKYSGYVKLHMALKEGDRIRADKGSSLFLSTDRGNFVRLYEYGRVEVTSLEGKFLLFRYISGSVYANTIRDLGTGVAFDLGYGKKVYMYGVGAFRIEGTQRGGWKVVVREGKVRITHERGELVLAKGETLRSEGERLVRGPTGTRDRYERTYPYYNGGSYRYYSSYGYYPSYGYSPYYSGYYPYYGGYYPSYGFSFGYYGGHHRRHRHYGGDYGYGYGGHQYGLHLGYRHYGHGHRGRGHHRHGHHH